MTKKVALLSPYGGGNLGDTAILHATMEHLRAVVPGATFLGITLSPGSTLRKHHIGGIALLAAPLPFYGAGRASPPVPTSGPLPPLSSFRGLKERSKRHMPRAFKAARSVFQSIRRTALEIRHWSRAYAFMRSVDALVVAGSGQLDEEWGGPWGHPYALFKWTLIARWARRPSVVLSIGASRLASRLGRWFSRCALARAQYVSFRDGRSVAFAEAHLGRRSDPRVPDLAFSLPLPDYADPVPPARQGELTIGVSPIAYGRPDLWPTRAHTTFENYVNALHLLVRDLLAAGHRVVLFNTDSPDKLVIHTLEERLRTTCAAPALDRLLTAYPESLEVLLPLLRTLDVVVASRLHGVILSHVVGRPVLAISYDPKVEVHMQEIGQAQFTIDIHRVEHTRLAAILDELCGERAIVANHIRRTAQEWRAATTAQYGRIARFLGQPWHCSVESVATPGRASSS